MVGKHRLSITTGCLNRADFLRQSLITWLQAPEPDEIVIVDWGNLVPLEETLASFKDSRLVFARVLDQPTWKNSKCHNLEVELASGELLLRLDSDYLLKDDFFAKHPVAEGRFYAGNWKPWVGDVEKCSLAGSLYAFKADILLVNGYNERLVYYGCEDDDLFERMSTAGLNRIDVDFSTLKHISHPDRLRYENLEIASGLRRFDEHEVYNEALKKLHLVDRSRVIAGKKPWSKSDHRTSWSVQSEVDSKTGHRRFHCEETVAALIPPQKPGGVVFTEQQNELIPLIQSITEVPVITNGVQLVSRAQIFGLLYRAARIACGEELENEDSGE
jgi:hypothetical protein